MNKYVFITGVSSGIGYGLCDFLISKSFHIIGTVRNESDKHRLEQEFGNAIDILVLDVTDETAVKSGAELVKTILKGSRLDALINNAGIAVPGPLADLTSAMLNKQLDVNVVGILNITNALLPFLKGTDLEQTNAGRIINISSISGLLNTPFLGAYCISKHAVESLSDIYRRELDMFGIKVIIIEPGPIKSDIWDKSLLLMENFKDSEYAIYLHGADKMVESTKKHALESIVLSKSIYNAIVKKKPKLRYIVHTQKRMIYVISRFLPARLMDYFTRKKLASMKKGKIKKRY